MKEQQDPSQMTRRGFCQRLAAFALAATSLPLLTQVSEAAPKWKDDFELAVNFKINKPGGTRYHRPFVAAWIEDANGKSVRTLCLWYQQTNRGFRWLPDLKRWYRLEKKRKAERGGDLAKVISSATRKPGNYSLVWNGRDDDGKQLDQGTYFVCIEAARENGTYQIIREDVSIGSRAFRKALDSNIEIKEASVEYRKK